MSTLQTNLVLNNKKVKFNIYDYDFYQKNEHENRIGLDIVSKCLEVDKCWEPFQTELTKEIMELEPNGIFIDVGCHLGYYSVLVDLLGCKVKSIDANENFLGLLKKTIDENNLTNIDIYQTCINESFTMNDINYQNEKITLIKIDIEGFEHFFIDKIENLLKNSIVSNMIIEISPKINDTYSDLCRKISNYGYSIYDIGLSPQRPLVQNTCHMASLEKLNVNINDIDTYIKNLPYGQSNFLFKKNIK